MISDSLKIQAPPIAEYPKVEAWYHRPAEKVLADLGSAATGLSAPEAGQRIAADAPNELKAGKRIGPVQIILGQFKSLVIWILIAAGIISTVCAMLLKQLAPNKQSTAVRSRPWRLLLRQLTKEKRLL